MRTTTAAELAALQATEYEVHARVEVQNDSGTWIDLSTLAGFDWLAVVEWSQHADRSVIEARTWLRRSNQDGPDNSLAPLLEGSPLNVDDAGAYAPLLDGGRGLRVYALVTEAGTTPASADLKLVFDGEIDDVAWHEDPVMVVGRAAIGAEAHDRIVETLTEYGSAAGTAIETTMQAILNDWTAGPTSLYTPSSPGFNITTTPFVGLSVLEALHRLVALIGYTVREKWDNGTSAFRLTFEEPDRAVASTVHTFTPDDYFAVEHLEVSRKSVRNVIILNYYDANGERQSYTASDATSIARYGRQVLIINEGPDSPINTAGEAQTMADAALADLKDPVVEKRVRARFFWPVQLDDFYAFTAAEELFDTTQNLAVVGWRHELREGHGYTYLDLRGKPIGFSRYWSTLGVRGSSIVTPAIEEVTHAFGPDGALTVRVRGSKETGSVRVAVDGSAFPSEATVDAATVRNLDSDGWVEVSFGGNYGLGADVYVSAKAYETAAGAGASSSLRPTKVTRESVVPPRVQADWERVSSTTAALDLTIEDPTLSVTAVRFNKREGSESGDTFTGWVTTWDRSTGTIGSSATLTRGEDVLVEEGQESIIRWEVDFTDEEGNTQTVAGAQSSANTDEHETTLLFPATVMVPSDDATTWLFPVGNYLTPNVLATSRFYHLTMVLPDGVTITEVGARYYRFDTAQKAEVKFRRLDNTGAGTLLATLTHASTGWVTAASATLSETVAAPNVYAAIAELQADTASDRVRLMYISVTYTRHHQNEKY